MDTLYMTSFRPRSESRISVCTLTILAFNLIWVMLDLRCWWALSYLVDENQMVAITTKPHQHQTNLITRSTTGALRYCGVSTYCISFDLNKADQSPLVDDTGVLTLHDKSKLYNKKWKGRTCAGKSEEAVKALYFTAL